jgi:hypothetical protein
LDCGRETLGHDLEKTVEVGQLLGGQEPEHSSHGLLPGALNLVQQAGALLAELAVDNATVVGSVASHDKATALNSIDQLGGRGVGHAQLVRELANRNWP